jgi:CspA family cold shock protein
MLASGGEAQTTLVWATPQRYFLRKLDEMAEGTIKRLTEKGFGFIDTGGDKDLFFHHSSVEGVSFDDLREGQRVTFTEGRGEKGPRAEDVKLA